MLKRNWPQSRIVFRSRFKGDHYAGRLSRMTSAPRSLAFAEQSATKLQKAGCPSRRNTPMKRIASPQSGIFILRCALVISLLALSTFLGFLSFAAAPAAGTISPSGPNLTWNGTASGLPPTGGAEDSCEEGTNCDTFKLTITGTPADWAAAVKVVHVQINWSSPSTDYDLY